MSWNRVHIVQFLLLISVFEETLSDEFRLPKHVVPRNYNLTIIPSFNSYEDQYVDENEEDLGDEGEEEEEEEEEDYNFGDVTSFEGIVIIQMECLIEGSKNITLHAEDITVTSYNLTDDNGRNISIDSFTKLEDKSFLVFNLNETLNLTSNYSLFLKYQAKYNEGFFAAFVLYYTSLPLIHARSVFPCFDEPEFKATFDLTLGRKSYMNTLSNMPHRNNNTIKRSPSPEVVFDEFETTPNMSTHVLGFHISNFSSKSAPNTSNVDIKMWAEDHRLEEDSNELLQKVGAIYNRLQKYLNFTQPINKQDLVQTDLYVHEGADSWGLINFDPNEIYIGNKSLPYFNERNLISLAHKLSHQWLGNLVTPSWWSDLWVSEGTSTFMSYFVLREEINKIWDKFSYDVFQDMLTKDSKGYTLPLKYEVMGNLENFSSFLYILSEKGACITRMMMKTFGDEIFKNATQNLLKEFSFRNVDEDDLWSSLQKSVNNTNISVKDIMSGWTNQSGYPLVTVNVSEVCRHMLISQKQFFDRKENSSEKLWKIPLKYQVIDIENQTVVDKELKYINANSTMQINDTSISNNTLVIANVKIMGFFRINYDTNNWDKIIKQLLKNHTIIDVLNRAQFMDDTFSFVGPCIENYTLGMRISKYLVNETEELPWLTFFKHLGDFYNNIIRNNINSTFMKYLKNITENVFKPLNLTELESETLGLTFDLNMNSAQWACLSGNKNCSNWAINAFDKWKTDTEKSKSRKIYKERRYLRTIVCSKLINNTDNATFQFFTKQLKSNYRLHSTVSCVQKEYRIRLILKEKNLQIIKILPFLSQSPVGRHVMREELQNITDRGQLLKRDDIYNLLTLNLKNSLNETEFNTTESVFESIVSWPQVNTTTIDPKFNLSAIKNHTSEIRLTWLDNKKIEEEVISVVT